MLHCRSVAECLKELPKAEEYNKEMKQIAQVAEATVTTAVTKLSRFWHLPFVLNL